ncbi:MULTISPECIES: histidine phosphatase family protein [Acetobacteraceae]|uniref:Phosphoglycerate mutase n=2 Tax=Acetobacteraceae TaxID=433 RepID=A0A023D223_ACIMT|nr:MULTISPECIES: histidine phosphatase family protein [Acetobacteraceae]KXV74180.1 phosphoglycerate mutase [Acetobacter malorum]TCS25118.1 putative phosphoglycerate mutase [Acidomonas methanolica]GAJ27876.1 phosphoglycerate mutase [Acidomonas methanolica NBRC 104435]GBQ46089.1 fructose-2,6-bisphosphatase [Acidomonas methanolica]GEK99793.1 phosphoglycerate mutase [Acidomonas methanolica NBRC 104435]
MTTVWMVRHGETAWSLSGQHTGRTDIALTERGRRQAKALAPLLSRQVFTQVLCSPLARARETCSLAGFGARAIVEPDLAEWDYGIYEGKATAEIRHKEKGWSLWTADVAGGENLDDLQQRSARLVRQLLTHDGTVLLFAHAHILRCIAGVWIDNRAALGEHFYLETASISVLGIRDDVRIIKKFNVTIYDR